MMKTSADTTDLIPEEPGALSDYSTEQRRIEIAAIVLFAVLALWSLWRLAIVADEPMEYCLVAGAAFAGWVAADLFSGLVHWGFDTWGNIHTPLLGQRFIRPFREHHWDAKAITRHDFIETNGAGCIASVPILVGTTIMPFTSSSWFFLQAFGVFGALAVLLTNQCHKWAHMEPEQLASPVRLAQRLRLILRPQDHRKHHVRPFNSHYCTATGWLNGPLQAIRFFRWMERCVTLCTRTGTRRSDQ